MRSTLSLIAYHLILLGSTSLSYLPFSLQRFLHFLETSHTRRAPSVTWELTQQRYSEWTKKTLPERYLQEIRLRGQRLAQQIGELGVALDIGCGNGLYNGMSYEEAGYSYMNPHGAFVVGLDPLPLEGPLPLWLSSYVVGVGEYIPFRDGVFTKSVIATTLDHARDQGQLIAEAARVTSDSIFIWTSTVQEGRGDLEHISRVVWESLRAHLERHFSEIDVFLREVYVHRDVIMVEAIKSG